MRLIFLVIALLANLGQLNAQTLTGKWKGYFTPNNDPESRVFTYEMDIVEQPHEQLIINTFTRLNTNFSAKANATGLFTKNSKLVSVTENKFEDVKMNNNLQACLMTNYLMYTNIRGHEIIEGTYTSYNAFSKKDCGGGQVYLEKVLPIVTLSTSKKIIPIAATKNIEIKKVAAKTESSAEKIEPKISINKVVQNSQNRLVQNVQINNTTPNKEIIAPDEIVAQATVETDATVTVAQGNSFQSIPWALVVRENRLVKKISTTSNKFSIDLYDNGTIDNDTIIVYDNKQLLVNKKRLSYKAIHLDLSFSSTVTQHEIIIVAHNMGTVPPNTALLVLKDGITRQEYYITSTNKMNAKLLINYTPIPQ